MSPSNVSPSPRRWPRLLGALVVAVVLAASCGGRPRSSPQHTRGPAGSLLAVPRTSRPLAEVESEATPPGAGRFESSGDSVRCSVPDAPVEGAGSVSLGTSIHQAPSAWLQDGVLSFGTHGTKETSASVWLSGHLFEVQWEPDAAGVLRCTSVEFREAQVVTGVLLHDHPGSVLLTAGDCRAREIVLDPSGAFYVELEGEGPCWLQAFTPPDLLGDPVAVGDGAEEEVVVTLPADREAVYWGWMPALASIGRPGRMDLVIAEVTPGSPAAKAGFQVGDEITGVGGTPVAELDDSLLGAWMAGTRGEVFLVELRGPDGGVRVVELRVE